MSVITALFALVWLLALSVTKRPNGSYRAVYRGHNGRQHSKTFPAGRKQEAQAWEAAEKAKLRNHTWVDPADRTTLAEFTPVWVARQPFRPNTVRLWDSFTRRYLSGHLGRMPLQAIKPTHVQEWLAELVRLVAEERLSMISVHQSLRMMRTVLNGAVRDGLIGRTPAIGVMTPTLDRRPDDFVALTVEQVAELAEAMRHPTYRAMALIQSMTGMRRGELQGLRVCDIRFLDRKPHIRVEQQLIYGKPAPPKTPASKRHIPLIAPAAEVLARHLQRYPATGEELVFTSARDRNPIVNAYWLAFKAAVPLTGLPARTKPHDLRHHYASILVAHGESVLAVARWLGHTNAEMIYKTYGHLLPDSDERSRSILTALWAPPESVDQTWTDRSR